MDEMIILPHKKAQAVELLLCGMSDREIAREIGMSRETVNRWRNHDADFRQVLRERRVGMTRVSQGEIWGLTKKAVATVRELMDSESDHIRLGAAKTVLRGTKALEWENDEEEMTEVDLIIQAIEEFAEEQGLNNLP